MGVDKSIRVKSQSANKIHKEFTKSEAVALKGPVCAICHNVKINEAFLCILTDCFAC